MKLTSEQFFEHFNDRLRMLKRSADAYDQGDYAEAARLAGSIIKLIGDRTSKEGKINGNFISLASRLAIKPEFMVDASMSSVMTHAHLHGPLCTMGLHLEGARGLAPILDGFERKKIESTKKVSFNEWWSAPVLRDCRGNEFSRKFIVETMRDKEDAHTDSDLDPSYADIAYNGAIGITQVNHRTFDLDVNPARVVVRQIAHEVLRTFIPELPPQFLQTKDLMAQPIMLYEVMEKNERGQWNQLLDHKAIEFRARSTSTPEVWQAWAQFSNIARDPTLRPTIRENSPNLAIRVVMLNYAPYPVELVRMNISTQPPDGQPASQ